MRGRTIMYLFFWFCVLQYAFAQEGKLNVIQSDDNVDDASRAQIETPRKDNIVIEEVAEEVKNNEKDVIIEEMTEKVKKEKNQVSENVENEDDQPPIAENDLKFCLDFVKEQCENANPKSESAARICSKIQGFYCDSIMTYINNGRGSKIHLAKYLEEANAGIVHAEL